MTVFVYVNTAKRVGDAEHIKVFASIDAAEKWFEENDPDMRFSNEPHQPQDYLRTLVIMVLLVTSQILAPL